MRFDLLDLRLFLRVVDHGSITRGAAATHLALPSASARITGMEAALGAPLLERRHRGVVATPAGVVLARHARTVLAQVERMRGDLGAFARGLKGEVRLFTNTAALTALVPDVLRDFLLAQPQIDVILEERHSAEIGGRAAWRGDRVPRGGFVRRGAPRGRLGGSPSHPGASRRRGAAAARPPAGGCLRRSRA